MTIQCEISYRNFTKDRVPKYKANAVEKLFNNLGVFFSEGELVDLSILDSIASTRDSIAHGDFGVEITKMQLVEQLEKLENLMSLLSRKLVVAN